MNQDSLVGEAGEGGGKENAVLESEQLKVRVCGSILQRQRWELVNCKPTLSVSGRRGR